MLDSLLEGVELESASAARANVVVIDVAPNRSLAVERPLWVDLRYNEWGRAIAEMQKEQLKANRPGRNYFFTSYSTDQKLAATLKSDMAGSFMTAQSSAAPLKHC